MLVRSITVTEYLDLRPFTSIQYVRTGWHACVLLCNTVGRVGSVLILADTSSSPIDQPNVFSTLLTPSRGLISCPHRMGALSELVRIASEESVSIFLQWLCQDWLYSNYMKRSTSSASLIFFSWLLSCVISLQQVVHDSTSVSQTFALVWAAIKHECWKRWLQKNRMGI